VGDKAVLLDGFTRVHESVHRVLADVTPDELRKEPHPPMGWLVWRFTRVMDSNVSRLSGRDQLWIGDGWHARFGMPPEPFDFGRNLAHTRAQVRAFNASKELILEYESAAAALTKAYIEDLPPGGLDRELNEPQYTPLPTVAVRLMSLLENAMTNMGQVSYLKAYHRLGGWFPSEDPNTSYR